MNSHRGACIWCSQVARTQTHAVSSFERQQLWSCLSSLLPLPVSAKPSQWSRNQACAEWKFNTPSLFSFSHHYAKTAFQKTGVIAQLLSMLELRMPTFSTSGNLKTLNWSSDSTTKICHKSIEGDSCLMASTPTTCWSSIVMYSGLNECSVATVACRVMKTGRSPPLGWLITAASKQPWLNIMGHRNTVSGPNFVFTSDSLKKDSSEQIWRSMCFCSDLECKVKFNAWLWYPWIFDGNVDLIRKSIMSSCIQPKIALFLDERAKVLALTTNWVLSSSCERSFFTTYSDRGK